MCGEQQFHIYSQHFIHTEMNNQSDAYFYSLNMLEW